MPKKILLAVLGLLLLQFSLGAQQPPKKDSYETLLERVKKQDPDVSFTDLRLAYAESKSYDPYGGDKEVRKAMFAALNAKDFAAALTAADKMLAKNYLDLNGHFGAFVSHRELGNTEKSSFHKYVFQNLIKSINDSGDGKTMQTAFVVISVDEEYVWFNVNGMRVTNQELIKDNEHNYDKLTATDPKTEQALTIYFNIDKPYNWLGGKLKSNP
jgi:hypothetical protein